MSTWVLILFSYYRALSVPGYESEAACLAAAKAMESKQPSFHSLCIPGPRVPAFDKAIEGAK